jgi:cobalt-zinc-cadmium resistance protein CzcA
MSAPGLVTGSLQLMRPVLMACLAAGLGLLPAALSNRIGAQAQQPLARVVVGGMLTTALAILFVLPLLARKRNESVEQHELEFAAENKEAQVGP